jgi:hypothetical protein
MNQPPETYNPSKIAVNRGALPYHLHGLYLDLCFIFSQAFDFGKRYLMRLDKNYQINKTLVA